MSEDRQINDDAKKAYDEAKKAFQGFKGIETLMPNEVVINGDALPKINSMTAQERINKAMERLYGKEPEATDNIKDKSAEDMDEYYKNNPPFTTEE